MWIHLLHGLVCVYWWIYNEALRSVREEGGSIISTCTVLKVEKSHLHVEGPLFFAQLKNKSISHFGKWGGGGELVGFIADSQ